MPLTRVAGALGDPTRAEMCFALLDGCAWTATELARHVGVAPSTASEHLTRLVEAGVLAEERQGRHRYLRLAGPEIAQLIEDVVGVTPEPVRPTSLRQSREARTLAAARTCYDHLAGSLGVSLLDAMVARHILAARDGLALTPAGREWVIDLAGETALRSRGRRPLLRTCLDWTERRHHLGGALGAVLLRQFLDREWVVRVRPPRALRLTDSGAVALLDLLGLAAPRGGDHTMRSA